MKRAEPAPRRGASGSDSHGRAETWEPFESAGERYELWYATPRGRRASRAEEALLEWLLGAFPDARHVVEVGCGTGHFTEWFIRQGIQAVGLDRSPAMLAMLRRRLPTCPAVLADAHALPLRDAAVDLVAFVTTLEFLEDPRRALAEAIRVARRGVLGIVLNRWSLGAISRRLGVQARGLRIPVGDVLGFAAELHYPVTADLPAPRR
jgi:ubiquinone/menaquinone biosynthesis C-methylase UbiE